jgi:hypothetical protein
VEEAVRKLFERYQRLFRQALDGNADLEDVASSYASGFVAASPSGVRVGENGEQLKEVMKRGFEHYRQIGTKDMRLRDIRIVPIDEQHCLAQVAWTAIYDRGADPVVSIDFQVHYLVQQIDPAPPKIFGWISGDEQAVLKEHGIL